MSFDPMFLHTIVHTIEGQRAAQARWLLNEVIVIGRKKEVS